MTTAEQPSNDHALTPASVQRAVTAPKRIREPRISAPLKQAINLLATGECKTQKAAAERVGLTEQHLSRMLNRAEIQAFVAKRAAENISRGVFRASTRIVELIDAESEHVAAKVSERLLEHAGVLRAPAGNSVNVNINNNIASGYIVDLSGNAPATVDASSTPDRD